MLDPDQVYMKLEGEKQSSVELSCTLYLGIAGAVIIVLLAIMCILVGVIACNYFRKRNKNDEEPVMVNHQEKQIELEPIYA